MAPGKTTLLNILAGELSADGGDYFLSQDKTIGYLKQKNNFETENTVIEEVHKIFQRLADMEQSFWTFLRRSLRRARRRAV